MNIFQETIINEECSQVICVFDELILLLHYAKQNIHMKRKTWTSVAAVVLIALLLWWLFWAILADEDINEMELQNTEIVE